MKLPSPEQLGLPEKFSKWRTIQEQAFSVTVTHFNTKRVIAPCMPTGSGKMPFGVGVGRLFNRPTCIVTESRGLQKQGMEDFSEIGMTNLMGRDNYPCLMREDEYSCEQGAIARCPYRGTTKCPYSTADMRMRLSSLGITNYAKWMTPRGQDSPFSHFAQVVFDEGHSAPEALARAMQFRLSHTDADEFLEMEFPHNIRITKDWEPEVNAQNIQAFKQWSRSAKLRADIKVRSLQADMERKKDPGPTLIKEFSRMKELARKLGILMLANPNNWVVDDFEHGYVFDPIRPGRYAEGMMFLGINRIIIMSATLREKTLRLLGLSRDQYHYQEFDSEFDPKLSPIYYVPTMRVDAQALSLRPLWIRFDQFMTARRDRKGLINTVSYARRDDLMGYSRYTDSMIINTQGEPPTDMVQLFKASDPGTVLVSPSVGTGYDFPGTELEWIIMAKIPFEPPSKIVKARDEDDQGQYRGYRAAQAMDQTFGRGTRYPGDQCEGAIFDDHMKWFLKKFGGYFSKNFHRRYRYCQVLPQPLPKMPKGRFQEV